MPYVSFNIGSNDLWIYVTLTLPSFLLINSSIFSIGPGLYKAIAATKSENLSGFNFFKKFFIPSLSN